MADHPFDKVVEDALVHIKRGHAVFQKFTCAKCGSRQTMDVPNTFYRSGICEECKHETQIDKQGCNFVLIMTNKKIV